MDGAPDAPHTALVTEDEAGLDRQATPLNAGSPSRQTPLLRVDPGRTPAACYAARDWRTGQERVSRSPSLTAQARAPQLNLVVQAMPDRPSLLVGDRAPWPRGQSIRQRLPAKPRLTLID